MAEALQSHKLSHKSVADKAEQPEIIRDIIMPFKPYLQGISNTVWNYQGCGKTNYYTDTPSANKKPPIGGLFDSGKADVVRKT
jgi:hypothetical protein